MHHGAVMGPLPPMFSVAMLSALIAQTKAKALLSFGGEKEIQSARSSRARCRSCWRSRRR
jgi:hypothetical protein